MIRRTTLAALVAAALFPISGLGATYTVTTLSDTLNVPGQTSFRDAIIAANAGTTADTIQFAPSLFSSGPATLSMGGAEFGITRSVNIVGPGQSTLTVDAQNFSRAFNISSSSATVNMSGMTITRGLAYGRNIGGAPGSGGGIYSTGNLSLSNMAITACRADTNYILSDTVTYGGGGIYNLQGNVSLQGVTVSGNSTSSSIWGGGILASGGTMNIQNSTVTANSGGGPGGGIGIRNGAVVSINASTLGNTTEMGNTTGGVTLTNSTANRVVTSGNSSIINSTTGDISTIVGTTKISGSTVNTVTASNFGTVNIDHSTLAKLDHQWGDATVKSSTFRPSASGTQAVVVSSNAGTTLLEQVTINGYASSLNGTVAIAAGGNVTLRNSTISGNQSNRGGGIYVASGNLNMDSTIVFGNTATILGPDISGTINGQNNLVGNNSGAFLLSANNLVGVNPLLGPLADNGGPTLTMALAADSPALDTGWNPANLQYDQRGFSRLSGSGVDIGAYEFQVPEPSSLSVLVVSSFALIRRPRRSNSA